MAYTNDIIGLLQQARDELNTEDASTAHVPNTVLGVLQSIRDLLNTEDESIAAYGADVNGVLTNIRDLLNTGDASTAAYQPGQFGLWQAICAFANTSPAVGDSTAIYRCVQTFRDLCVLGLVGGGTPDWVPDDALVFIDFKNGRYYFGGAEHTRAETVEENADYNDFDTALIVPDVGFRVVGTFEPGEGGDASFGPVLTAAAKTDLLEGFTVVASVVLDVAATNGSDASVQIELTDLPDYTAEWVATITRERASGADADAHSLGDFNAVTFSDAVAVAAAHKFAATLASDHFAISTDGGAVDVASGTPVDNTAATDIGISCNASALSATCTAVLESIAFYPIQLDAALPALSTVTGPPVNRVAPVLSGDPTEGETLSSTTGTWTGAAVITLARQWYQAVLENPPGDNDVVVDGDGNPLTDTPIVGETGATYDIEAGDIGERIFCVVTATNGDGSVSEFSNVTDVIEAAASYTGPGDIVSGAQSWCGLRAYSVAAIGMNAVRLVRASDSAQQNFVTLADGSLDTASIATFLAATTGKVVTLFDQTGNGNHLTQSNDALRPAYSASGLSSKPSLTFATGSSQALLALVTPASTQPITVSTVVQRNGAVSDYSVFFDWAGGGVQIGFGSSTGQAYLYAGTQVTATGATQNAPHAIQYKLDGAASVIYVDGASNTVSPGTTGFPGSDNLRLGFPGFYEFNGAVSEVGVWFSGLSGGNLAAIDSNQQTYWGF